MTPIILSNASITHIMNKGKTLISLLNWKNHADTIKCIEQLLAIGINVSDILVSDNASPNDSVDRIKNAFPNIEIIRSPKNNGFAADHKIAADIAIKTQGYFRKFYILAA